MAQNVNSHQRNNLEGGADFLKKLNNDYYGKKEDSGTTNTSSSCASPQTDSSSVNASPATELCNQKFRFKMENRPTSTIEEALKTEKEFIEYAMTLQAKKMGRGNEESVTNQEKSNSGKIAESGRKVGLDHLDNLCKLMEQLSELRDSNVKLKRRVQYLEDVKTLHEILRSYPASETKDDMAIVRPHNVNEIYKSHTLATVSQIQKEARERSKSTDLNYSKSKRKFPKWSKVKEALGFERSNQMDLKAPMKRSSRDYDDKICRELCINYKDDDRKDISPARSLPDRSWYMGSVNSSSEDILEGSNYNSEQPSWEDHRISLCLSDPQFQDDCVISRRKSCETIEPKKTKEQNKKTNGLEDLNILGKLEKDDLKKSTKTPWGKVKTIIQTRRDSLKQRQQQNKNYRSLKVDHILDEDLENVKNLDEMLENKKDSADVSSEKKRKISTQQQMNKPGHKDSADSSSGQVSNIVEELQKNLSEDFNKKIEEWEKIKAKSSSLKSEHKDNKRGKSKKIERGEKTLRQRVKDLNWLEKELQKVDSEMQRLSKEKQKWEKRAVRLERLKQAMLNSNNKKEVFVKTSAGEFRFEGISDSFTKKLYEWEMKQGLDPEVSTIALLDSCLKSKSQNNERVPLKKGYSRSETSLADANPQSPSSSPSCKYSTLKQGRNQLSRANSEPDLTIYSGQKEETDKVQSYSSGDLSSHNPSFNQDVTEEQSAQINNKDNISENNYCGLLEDNMYLLEQLRSKEEICRGLQEELQRLDDRTELMTKQHQEEMERYREKLWEIHRPGRKPKDLQSSLKLIACLKTRIEELQRCSEKLKLDRETLEESFRYHSEQQARLADGLAEKMKELQQAGWASNLDDGHSRREEVITCSAETVAKLNDLSTQLLQQARDVDKTLAERSRQVCHLRWELLHRDVSMMLLQAEVHRAKWQSVAAGGRRARFKQKRSWSSSERLYPKEREDSESEEWLQNRLKHLSTTTYSDWPKIECGPSELVGTIHELKKTLLKLSTSIIDADPGQEVTCRTESEVADSEKYEFGSINHSRSSSFSSEISSQLGSSRPDSRLYDNGRLCGQRRNSLGNISSMSGADVSDSSSVNEAERSAPCLLRLPWKTWHSKDNVSTSSESSFMDEESLAASWFHSSKYDYAGDDKYSEDDLWSRELNIQFSSLNEEDEDGSSTGNERNHSASANSVNSLRLISKCNVQSEGKTQNASNNPTNRRSSDSSNEIIVDKLTDVSSLKVRTSSFKQRSTQNTASTILTQEIHDDVTRLKSKQEEKKTSPILPTYVQRLDLSLPSTSSQVHHFTAKTEKKTLFEPSDSSKIAMSEVTVPTQKVKLNIFGVCDNTIKNQQMNRESKECTLVESQLKNEIDTQINCVPGIENAGYSRNQTSSAEGTTVSEQENELNSDFLKLPKNKEGSVVNALCKQTLLFSLNSPVIKSVGSRVPPQSPTSSPEADSASKGKIGWLSRNLFRQK
ncbi:putative leucine-rich repeat-containing protein DDB_G0290503 [Centruroides vittatus]|uniref:putative leucine-rich repeat-containing protein DDB_G0290503 n=1 Tax=Centruroides vittatus TaxID=120091 RepID=UPI00350E8F1F